MVLNINSNMPDNRYSEFLTELNYTPAPVKIHHRLRGTYRSTVVRVTTMLTSFVSLTTQLTS